MSLSHEPIEVGSDEEPEAVEVEVSWPREEVLSFAWS